LGWPEIWAGHGRRVGFWRGRALVDVAIATIIIICPVALMLFYRATLPLSSQTLAYAAGVIRRHRKQIGSRWRELSCGRQTLLVSAYLRKGETFADLAAGFGVGTAWRYVTEAVAALLAARSPKLRRALAAARKAGHAYVVTDGTLIQIDRVAADRPFYSGKHRRHGMNLQVIATLRRRHRVVSGPLRGAVHDLTAARIWGIVRKLRCCPWRAGQLAKDPRSSGPRDRKTKSAQWADGRVL
jgi:DDE superfamily endonuclease/Helix-turn-helix of DDE superfamily endonuclease